MDERKKNSNNYHNNFYQNGHFTDDNQSFSLFSTKMYKFFWESNSSYTLFDSDICWEAYDEDNQIHLNNSFKEYNNDENNCFIILLPPYDHFAVDFSVMKQYNFNNPEKIRSIKFLDVENKPLIQKDNFNNESTFTESENQYIFQIKRENNNEINTLPKNKKNNEDYTYFFWQSNQNLNSNEKIWSPYEIDDEIIIKKAFYEYLDSSTKNTIKLRSASQYFIDFIRMLQLNQYDRFKQREVQICDVNSLDNILRPKRFETALFCAESVNLLDKTQIIKKADFKDFLNQMNSTNIKKRQIFFEVFFSFPIKIDIEDKYDIFPKETSIVISLDEMKTRLKREIIDLGKEFGSEYSISEYTSKIEQIDNSQNFFENIIKIFTIQGYLKSTLNEYLRNFNIQKLRTLENYYISLLASFEYFKKIKHKSTKYSEEDLIVYRVTTSSINEFTQYQKLNNKKIIRIFDEFISTSPEKKNVENYFNKYDSNSLQFYWEIKIPQSIIINEAFAFADISELSYFPVEKEILLRSGIIIEIEEIVPYTEKVNNQIITFSNKYRKICTVKSFILSSLNHFPKFDSSLILLNLMNWNLGTNLNYINILTQALLTNSTIKIVSLFNNNLGENENNILYLKELFDYNKSIVELDLRQNNIGKNDKNMFYIKEFLVKNNSIKKLNLGCNNLAENEKCMHLLKDALEMNKTLEVLNLDENNFGECFGGLNILKNGFKNNQSIHTLTISLNNLGKNEQSILIVKEILAYSPSIRTVFLSNNNLGSNEKSVQILKEILNKYSSNIQIDFRYNNVNYSENNRNNQKLSFREY